ncbi:hypothetical protein XA68_15151 [Ophiocordyceps unilateralis]|uniref:Prokaryotic-type class I peptide chain release factors domain-containing protein n=1 Tax=Ophiocordyceps unilateralis TaxID=268505 RepID=A0A2A9P8Z7_OPHUN|nr:hypothetical protein XA68_15151 [Ophiocordyceps unilateralis]
MLPCRSHLVLFSSLLLRITPPSSISVLKKRPLSKSLVVVVYDRGGNGPAQPPLARTVTSFPPRPKPPPDSEIQESYLKGSGPGGQKINKTSSAVQLIHIPTGLVVKSQATRSRSQNRSIARRLLADKIDAFRNGDQSRAALVGLRKKKRADSAAKKSRRKYRKLDEELANDAAPGPKRRESPGGPEKPSTE